MSKSISVLVLEYFEMFPKKDINHAPVVDWVTAEYLKENPEPPRDIWRAIRKLHQEGILIKVKKGVYRYDPDFIKEAILLDFPADIKEEIFKRDNYQCVVCGQGRKDGVEICADHIKPKDKNGDNSIENGQTLCTKHNLIKKNYSQTEAGKKYFIKMYKIAVSNNDLNMIKFCKDVFDVYDKHNIDEHIKRPD
ncbi:MAG: HNH endonuclease [Nitrospirae bacterium]|nr:HNH endonuclease [Nitrospirota bacterium]MBF0542053.1 HNH endonuclease [Nitrospirota bacterium]